MPRKTGPSPTVSATGSPPWACCWKTARAAPPGVWRTDQGLSLKYYRAHAPHGHAVLDAPRPVLDDVLPAERQTLNDPLLPQPLVQRVAADAQTFGQL
ncbi:hypothetical protein ALO91_103395 [Pseudomonas syringae pv. aceris]|uniref:Uncharacterized protein n=1 Tax=Pseudomonas syringae pv. aceris TaxID=199198 RepID=A0A0P9K3H8_PSESX|nr:hypothetical protein ALO91_103395 [Pseudomonas syringae pv. aceris]